ncbi:MAG: hypothetical protein AAGC91_01075 [Pseudomonadota bacterium]
MIIHPATLSVSDGRCLLAVKVELETAGKIFGSSGSNTETLWIDWPESYFRPEDANADPFMLICLPLAMCLNERLEVVDSVSQSLIVNVLEAMEIYKHYFPHLCEVVKLHVSGRVTQDTSRSARIGSFYSGGVDSLFNIAESQRLNRHYSIQPVTDLWLVQGMDIKLSDEALWSETKDRLLSPLYASERFRCADIRTNARDLHDQYVGYEVLGFSAILGGISKCFAPLVGTSLIGSYGTYADIIPHASSPLVDPMWSCDRQVVRHFTCRADRIEKIKTIGEHSPELLGGLRVCYKNLGGAYNCGRCEKCQRTQLQLLLCGHLEKSPTFESTLTPESLRGLRLKWHKKNQYTWDFWRDIESACADAGLDDYRSAVRRMLLSNKVGWFRRRWRTRLNRVLFWKA